jgi:hypothetical protein
MVDEQYQQRIPVSELDLSMSLTNTSWGSDDVSPELKDVLSKEYIIKVKDEKGVEHEYIEKSSLWGLLTFYTRDIRLGNLGEWNGELAACRFHLKVAGFYLMSNMIDPFLVRLSKAIAIIETSQSKNGFLRKQMNTLRNEHYQEMIEPKRKAFFGGAKPENGGYNQ